MLFFLIHSHIDFCIWFLLWSMQKIPHILFRYLFLITVTFLLHTAEILECNTLFAECSHRVSRCGWH